MQGWAGVVGRREDEKTVVRRRWFEVARRNDGTRTTVGRWVGGMGGWLVGRVVRAGGLRRERMAGRVTNRTRGRKRVTDSLATLYAT